MSAVTSILATTTPATSTRLTTRDRVFTELNLTDSDGKTGARIDGLIDEASQTIVSYLRRPLAKATFTETFYMRQLIGSGFGAPIIEVLQLQQWPITTLTSITEDGTALTASDYLSDPDRGHIRRLDSSGVLSYWSAFQVVVVYVAGFVLPEMGTGASTLPYDIERACVEIVKASWFKRTRDPLVRSEEIYRVIRKDYQTAGPGDSGIPDAAADLLNPYRRMYA